MTVKNYLDLPYNIIVRHIKDESADYYFATVLELDGCMGDGNTCEKAIADVRKAMKGWIGTRLDNGFPVPLPVSPENYSGKFVVRVPKSLHAKLSIAAGKEGISLNQYALYKLSS
jgi:predicted RNase H-like HicB family nuclease